ncbi:endonuclease toxin domain-containing protein [Shigella sp. FC1967]
MFIIAKDKVAIRCKSLDTQTMSKLNRPKQIYNTIKSNIDDVAKFEGYRLSGVNLHSEMIAKTRNLACCTTIDNKGSMD